MSNILSININTIINDIQSKTNDFKNNLNETQFNKTNDNNRSDDRSLSNDAISPNNSKLQLNDENRSIDSIISPKKRNIRIIPVKTLVNESNFVNFFRIILVLLCFGFFAYNVYIMTAAYLTYDTMVSLQYKPPDSSDLPGITVCGPFIIHPATLRDIVKDIPTYNSSDSLSITNSAEMEDKKNRFYINEKLVIEKNTAKFVLKNLSLKFEDLIMNCVFMNYTIEKDSDSDIDLNTDEQYLSVNCGNISDVVESIYEGRKCFTLFSRLNYFKVKQLQMKYDFNPKIEVTVKTKESLWSYGKREQPILMSVHPKTIIPTHLDFDYFTIFQLTYYQIYFRKKISTLLPEPWKTGCHDYICGCGYRMRQQCLGHCIRRLSTINNDCINWNQVITEDILEDGDKFCSESQQNYTVYIDARRICEDECPPECHQIIYEMHGNTVNLDEKELCKNEDNRGCNATVIVMLHTSPTIIINHTEAYPLEQFVGAVGGHLGIWLGLSVITIIDLLLTLMEKTFKLIRVNFIPKFFK